MTHNVSDIVVPVAVTGAVYALDLDPFACVCAALAMLATLAVGVAVLNRDNVARWATRRAFRVARKLDKLARRWEREADMEYGYVPGFDK